MWRMKKKKVAMWSCRKCFALLSPYFDTQILTEMFLAEYFDETIERIPMPIVNSSAKRAFSTNVPLFKIYPNPTDDYFTIDLNGTGIDKDTRLDILNMNGQILSSAEIDHLEVISTSDLESGIYFIRLHINGKLIESDKLVIIR